jgi:hypothetical protein
VYLPRRIAVDDAADQPVELGVEFGRRHHIIEQARGQRGPLAMPAITSPLMALRLSGQLMVIQYACPRFSRITPLLSVIALLAFSACFSGNLPWVRRHVQERFRT